jgi:SPP1 family predicted phage head-tail adaptor
MYTFDPGQLRDRIEIQRRATGQDALGQPAQGWELVAKLWANVRHLNGTEAIKAGAVTSAVNASIRIRWRAGIDGS